MTSCPAIRRAMVQEARKAREQETGVRELAVKVQEQKVRELEQRVQ